MFKKFQSQKFTKVRLVGVVFFSMFMFFSCEKEVVEVDNDEVTKDLALKCSGEGGVLLDYKLVNSMTAEQIIAVVGPAFESLVDYDVNMYKVSYLSKYKGKSITISGIVGIPDIAIDRSTPVVMYNHGTRVSEGDFVPSSGLDLLTVVAAANGKICFASDYVGYGDSKDFYPAYMINTADVFPACDMIVAGKEFLNSEYNIHGKLSLTMFGYSQGGSVTLAVQRELERNPYYRRVVRLKGVASGTGPYDLYDNVVLPVVSGDIYTNPVFMVFLFISYNNYYHLGYDLDDIFQNNYGQLFIELQESKVPYATINTNFPIELAELFQPEFRQDFISGNTPFNALFERNATHKGWVPRSPLRIFHSIDDEVVPYASALEAYNTFIDAGARDVELITYEGYSHTTTAFMSIFEILVWVDERNNHSHHRH